MTAGMIGAVVLSVVLDVRATPGNVEVLGSDTASMNAAAESFLSQSWSSLSLVVMVVVRAELDVHHRRRAHPTGRRGDDAVSDRAGVLDEDLRLAVLVGVVAGRLELVVGRWRRGDREVDRQVLDRLAVLVEDGRHHAVVVATGHGPPERGEGDATDAGYRRREYRRGQCEGEPDPRQQRQPWASAFHPRCPLGSDGASAGRRAVQAGLHVTATISRLPYHESDPKSAPDLDLFSVPPG